MFLLKNRQRLEFSRIAELLKSINFKARVTNETIDILDTATFPNRFLHGRLKDYTSVFLDCCILHFYYRVTIQTSIKSIQ